MPFAAEVEVATDSVVVPDAEGMSMVAEIDGGTEEGVGADDVPDPLDWIELSLDVWLGVLLAVPVGDVVDVRSVEEALSCLGERPRCAFEVDRARDQRSIESSCIAIGNLELKFDVVNRTG